GLLGFFDAQRRGAHDAAAETLDRLRRQRTNATVDQWQARQLVLDPEGEPREDLAPEPAGTDAVARVTGPVVDAGVRKGAEGREVVSRDVDRSATRPLEPDLGEIGQQEAKTGRCTSNRRPISGEAAVDATADPDRARAAPHHHPAVVRRPEVVQEHAPVGDRLTAGPVDLLEQVRDR